MPLPAIFNGTADNQTLYTLATLCRVCYLYSDLRRDLFRVAVANPSAWNIVNFVGTNHPPTVTIIPSDTHWTVVINGLTSWSQVANLLSGFTAQRISIDPQPDVWAVNHFNTWADTIKASLISQGVTGDKPILFVGHSAGGALANILQWKYVNMVPSKEKIVSVSFGAPRAGSVRLYVEKLGNHIYRVVNFNDLVTDLPPRRGMTWFSGSSIALFCSRCPTGWTHGGQLIWMANTPARFQMVKNYSDDSGEEARQHNNEAGRAARLGSTNLAAFSRGSHPIEDYARSLRGFVDRGDYWVLVSMDLLNTGLNLQESKPAWPAELLAEGYRRSVIELPEDRDYEASASGGDWAAEATAIVAAPLVQERPMFILPLTLPPTSPIIQERILRRRRTF